MSSGLLTEESSIGAMKVRIGGRSVTYYLFFALHQDRDCYFFVHYSRLEYLPSTPNSLGDLSDVIVARDDLAVLKDRDGDGARHFLDTFKDLIVVHEVHAL